MPSQKPRVLMPAGALNFLLGAQGNQLGQHFQMQMPKADQPKYRLPDLGVIAIYHVH